MNNMANNDKIQQAGDRAHVNAKKVGAKVRGLARRAAESVRRAAEKVAEKAKRTSREITIWVIEAALDPTQDRVLRLGELTPVAQTTDKAA
jgi:hypothetical protein